MIPDNPFGTEPLLMKAFHNRDERAFKFIFEHMYTRLCLHTYKIIDNEDEACDMVSEKFIYVFNNPEKFSSIGRIMNFMLISLRNAAYDKLSRIKTEQKSKKEFWIASDSYEELFKEELPDDLQKIITESVNKLPPRCRDVFKLRYFQELDCNQICDVMHMKYQTVLNQLNIARNLLRKILSPVLWRYD